MHVGVLREAKQDETRVALQPFQAAVLIEGGHKVFVEEGAGLAAGFHDEDYAANGAVVAPKAEVLEQGRLLLKVKAPTVEEFGDYRADQALFTYLHFDENIPRSDILDLIGSGFLGIAYEWVGEAGVYPLLEPMSRLTGYLFAQKALEICAREKGVFCPANEPFLTAGRALIIGLGNIGLSAFRFFSDLKLDIVVLANSDRDEVNRRADSRFRTRGVDHIGLAGAGFIKMNQQEPERTKEELSVLMPSLDIVINAAVRRSSLAKERMDYLIDRSMVAGMARNSVVCDATANDRDMIETCVSSASLRDTYREEGVVHYNCDHIPACVGRTATQLLTAATFPYVRKLADGGLIDAIMKDPSLENAVSCYRGKVTHRFSAEKKGIAHQSFRSLLKEPARPAGPASGWKNGVLKRALGEVQ